MRKKILMRFGNEYLFWSAGFYNVMELVSQFDIILLVPDVYKSSDNFKVFLDENSSISAIYAPALDVRSIRSHQRFYSLVRKILETYRPDIVVQNDYIELENMYLHVASKSLTEPIQNITRTLSRSSSPNTASLLYEKKFIDINVKVKSIFLTKIILYLVENLKLLDSYLSNVVFPYFFCGVSSYLRANTIQNIDNVPKFRPFDLLVSDEDFEVNYIKKLLPLYAVNIRKVSHASREIPVPSNDEFVATSGGILILPSLGAFFTTTKEQVETFRSFLKYILEFCEHDNSKDIAIKFHPSISRSKKNIVFAKVFMDTFPKGLIIESSRNVEPLLNQYTCIIGDASTSLMHARHRSDKVVISIDMENTLESDIMKNYDGINYIKMSTYTNTFAFSNLIKTKPNKQGLSFRDVLISADFC